MAWILLAFAIAREVRGLGELSDTVDVAGVATEETGRAVRLLERLPFVGEDLDRVGVRAEEAGASARASGRSSRESIEDLSILLGLAIALLPILPALALYLLFRIGAAREAAAVRRGLRDVGDDPLFREFLARRAVQHLPYRRLRKVSVNPWRDLEAGDHAALARAELERLGIEFPRERGASRGGPP